MLNFELKQLHQALEQAGIPIDGVRKILEESEGETITEIDFREEATAEQRSQAEAIVKNFVPQPQPNWIQLVTQFQMPGNSLYVSVLFKVGAAGFVVQDHWQNFKLLLSTPKLQSTEALAAAIGHLDTLLSAANQPLSVQDKQGWNVLIDACNFPIECRLI